MSAEIQKKEEKQNKSTEQITWVTFTAPKKETKTTNTYTHIA